MTNKDLRNCIECGKDIATKRKDAKYCGDRCRMRYQRQQKKLQVLTKLFNICSQIPNHAFKSTDGQSSIRIWNAKSKKTEIYTLKELNSLNIQQIEELLAWKKREVKALEIMQPIINR